ncbi:DEAD/DEAH box helicase [Methylibium rhizosphaerae]|uniref:preprotein translocase subunit SecA n=1 Tax=Methylibium rhizosphaerae TaxID=2570323 RepID=UPI0015E32B0E|nr:DEAD/DEAH box helicase [Methylibium rhizosphaerae]
MAAGIERFDGSLPRRLAGAAFQRADTSRDERAHPREGWIERFASWVAAGFAVRRAARSQVERIGASVAGSAGPLQSMDEEALRRQFDDAVQALRRLERFSVLHDPAASQAMACIGEACLRCFGFRPHPVQVAGAQVLLRGGLAEMNTGEGKTLVAAMAATLMAATGAAVHVVSTNDYLAQRDCEEMQPLFRFFGLSAGFVIGGMEADERRPAYRHPICYVAGKELVFDYLKDRLAGHGMLPRRVSHLQQLGIDAATQGDRSALLPALHFAIVDEADSVLIDEARTPMILSREAPGLYDDKLLQWAIKQARRFELNVHYRVMEERIVELMPAALPACDPLPPDVAPVWSARTWRELVLRQAVTALNLFHLDQHYMIAEGKVQIIDESTGRVMADRSWEQGLHQLIEVKEGLDTTQGRDTLARLTFQRFFRRYYLLSGLTGTASEAAREMYRVYGLRICRVPPHRPSKRRRLPDQVFADDDARWRAVARDAQAAAQRGQPVLVGTRSVKASERVAREFDALGLPHVVLNARQDSEEAHIVGQAGESGRITIATNMAGRGTDIKLTPRAREAGGLHVILTEFHESPRVDRQLFGRAGRQGDAGTARAIVCSADEVFKPLAGWQRRLLGVAGSRHQRWLLRWWLSLAQGSAEAQALRARMQTLKQDRELSRTLGFAGKVK